MSRKKRIAAAVLVSISALSAAFFGFLRSDFGLDAEIMDILNSSQEGTVVDLLPVESLLDRQWNRSPERFSRAFDRFFSLADYRKVSIRPESVLKTFEASHPGFCESLEGVAISEGLGTYCERSAIPFPKLPKIADENWTPPDCDAYVWQKNRQACLVSVNGVLSPHSDSHCSDSACKNDQSAFRALVFSGNAVSACSGRPSESLGKECEDFVSKAAAGVSGSGGGLGTEIGSAISGVAADAVSQAVRRAVFSDDSSPSEECSEVPSEDVANCEAMAKAAFEYAESERLRARILRIRSAASEYSSR